MSDATPRPRSARLSRSFAALGRRVLLLLPIGLAGMGVALAAAHPGSGSGRVAADTATVFGPKRFQAAGGGRPALYVERFTAPATALPHRLRVTTPAGEQRPARVAVTLNGATLFSAASSHEPVIEVPVLLRTENTLEVTIEGSTGAVELAILAPPGAAFALLQPTRFERTVGGPQVETARFSVPAGAGAPYRLHVINGEPDGTDRVSSAVVRLNGTPVIGPSDLNPQVGGMVRDVTPGRDNLLEVEVRSAPGSFLLLWVTATDTVPPVLVVDAPENEWVTRETAVDAAGRVLDQTPTTVTVNGAAAERTGDAFRARVPLAVEGANVLVFTAVDRAGLRTDSTRTVIRDTEPPAIEVAAPAEGLVTRDTVVRVSGTIRDRTRVTANVNGIDAVLDSNGAFGVEVQLPADGVHFLSVTATDQAGNSSSLVRQATRDTEPPAIAFTAPAEGTVTREGRVQVAGTVADAGAVQVVVNGIAMQVSDATFRGTVPLQGEGALELAAVATDVAGNQGRAVRGIVRDTTPPTLVFDAPAEGTITREAQLQASGSVADSTAVVLTLNGAPVAVDAGGRFSVAAVLAAEGGNTLALVATDAAGNASQATRGVVRDTEPPVVAVLTPLPGALTGAFTVTVTGTVADRTPVSVRVNGVAAPVDGAGAFAAVVPLDVEGANAIAVVAADAAGNEAAAATEAVRDTEAPRIVVASPADGLVARDERVPVAGRVEDRSAVTATMNGAPMALDGSNAFQAEAALAIGANAIAFAATDAAGNGASLTLSVTREEAVDPNLPPDPSRVAPPVDLTVASPIAETTEFLYTGENPIQTGVAPGTITIPRAAVLRGRVLDRELRPLPGAVIAVAGRPEFGSTLSRADGGYDLAVNGGGELTVDFSKESYLPAQRGAQVPWQDFVYMPDVVLIRPDARASIIQPGMPEPQLVRGSPTTDEDGTRAPAVVITPGTTWTIRQPDGTTVPGGTLTVRATEYTVGPSGPAAMPGELPPASAYTYAVDLSADEVRGGGSVEFSQPVPFYVENFLEFPVGTPVPVGAYDARQGAWVPENNGLVIQVLPGAAGGAARVDATGDGQPESEAALAQLGITPAELQALVELYPQGASVWRAPVTRLFPYDLNWGFTILGKDPGGTVTMGCATPAADPILCDGQAVTEVIPVSGTRESLVYKSNRMPGNDLGKVLDIQVTGPAIPAELKRVEVEVRVAGRVFVDTLPAQPNLRHSFRWDGKDAYGRTVQGTQPVTIRVGHIYPVVYQVPAETQRSFGLTCYGQGTTTTQQCVVPSNTRTPSRQEAARNQYMSTTLGGYTPTAAGMGGWTLANHHVYDPAGRVLYTGTGERRSAGIANPVATQIAGRWEVFGSPCRDGAGESVGGVTTLAYTPDGILYFGEGGRICARLPDGTVRRIAGRALHDNHTLYAPCSAEGQPARWSDICFAAGMALGPDGLLYFSEPNRVRRIEADGTLRTFAGTGTAGFAGDGGPARSAQFSQLTAIQFGPDGALYVADRGNNRVRRIGTDGMVTTVAGTGQACTFGSTVQGCTDGIPIRAARLTSPRGLAFGPDGSLYIAEAYRITRTGPDGTIRLVVGSGQGCRFESSSPCIEGLPGTEMSLLYNPPDDLAVDRFGVLYFTVYPGRILRVGPDGIVARYAGAAIHQHPSFRNGAYAQAVEIRHARGLAIGGDGALYTASSFDNFIAKVAPAGPAYTGDTIRIASESGAEVYVFDAAGRHLRTVNATTGTVVQAFQYDTRGHVSAIADANGRATRFERDAAGNVAAVVAPTGERTELVPGADGMLAGVMGPDGNQLRFTYQPGGLLAGRTDARGHSSGVQYDANGRVIGRQMAGGGSLALNRSGSTLSGTTGGGTGTSFGVQPLGDGGRRDVVTLGAGQKVVSTIDPSGATETRAADGTVTTVTVRPDPRFGMQAPLQTSVARLPSGLTMTVAEGRGVQLANAADPLSVLSQTDSTVVNGRVSRNVFNRAAMMVATTSAAGRTGTTKLDAQGRAVEHSIPGLERVVNQYDERGRLVRRTQGARTTTYTYDAHDRVESVTDPLGRTVGYGYDASGRVTTQHLPGGRVVTFRYDPNGSLSGLTPPDRGEHGFAYTEANLPGRYAPPVVGDFEPSTRLSYGMDLELERVFRPGGDTISTAYDQYGRPQQVSFLGGTVQFGYDAATGALRTATRPAGASLSYSYDGSLTTGVIWSGAVSGSIGYRYDNDFRVRALRIGADSVAFGYDPDGLLVQAGSLTIQRSSQNGLPLGTTLGGLTTRQGFNAYGERDSLSASFGGGTLFRTAYERDGGGRIRALSETIGGETQRYAYSYDAAGRLERVDRNGEPWETYEYDPQGNRTRAVSPSGVRVGRYDAQDRLIEYGEASYGYAHSGELAWRALGSDTTHYRYDAQGALQSVRLADGTLVEYVADAEGRRVGRRVNGQLTRGWLWDGELRPVAELDGAGVALSRFVYGERPNVPEYMVRGGRTYRLIHDHLGSVRMVVDAQSGEMAQRLEYDAWGRVIQDSNPGFQPFGYAGGLYDPQTGLTRFGARDYDAETGRWTAKDPAGFEGRDSNLYLYVAQDPVNSLDVEGRYSISEFVAAQGGRAALSQKLAINFFAGCITSVASGATAGYMTGNSPGASQSARDCAINGAISTVGFALGAYGAGAASKAMAGDAEMRAIFRSFGRNRNDVFDVLAGCVLAGSQASYNEAAGAVLGSPMSGGDVAAGQALGCLTGALDKLMVKNPIQAAVYGALLGSTLEFAFSLRDALQ